MTRSFARYGIFAVVIILNTIYACQRSNPSPVPQIQNSDGISLTEPADSGRFSPGQSIIINGQVTGSQQDYSFLKYYVLTSSGSDTLASGDVLVDGTIHTALAKNPLPGQYHIFLKAVNKSPDTKALSTSARVIFVDGPPPVILSSDSLSLTSPADSARFTTGQPIDVVGKVSGTQQDYSFLNYYVLTTTGNDTLAGGTVKADGSIQTTITKSLSLGQYHIFLKAVNKGTDAKTLSSKNQVIFVGAPGPLQITGFTNDDTSITVKWTRSGVSNFKSYQVYASRTDTGSTSPPYALGKLIATITDINQTTAKDNGVYIGYQYRYVVRQNTLDNLFNDSDPALDSAGKYFTLTGMYPFFDKARNRFYYYSAKTSNLLLTINPDLLTVENATDIGSDKELMGIDETGNSLNLVVQQPDNFNLTDSGQLFKFDLITHTLIAGRKFHTPSAYPVIAVSNNFAFFTQWQIIWGSSGGSISGVQLMNKAFVERMQAFNNNSDFLIHFASNRQGDFDSFYVFHISPGLIQQTFSGISTGGLRTDLPYTAGLIGDGTSLFDQSFHLKTSLPGNDYVTGISPDERFVVGGSNQVYRISDLSVAAMLGAGSYMPLVFFRSDGAKIYPIVGAISSGGPFKIYRYPWGK
jgi:hypothetical protein